MRTPWREAVDGKVKVLRDLRSKTTVAAMEQYFLESSNLRKMTDPRRFQDVATRMAVGYARVTEDGVRRAEPFWVWDSITRGIADRLAADVLREEPFRMTDLPTPEGLLWFQQPVKISEALEGEDSAWVRAIFFGQANLATLDFGGAIEFEGDEANALGVVAFLDSVKSGFTRASGRGDFLMPWICNALLDGQTIADYAAVVTRNTPDLNPTDLAMSTWPMDFCLEFFRLLRQKVLLQGGSGLEREARREAKKHGFEPSVRVVEWRKAEYRYPDGHIPAKVDWSCQWVVKPHLRRYKSGKVVQVRAYTKGPRDKPLKAVDNRVNVVKR